MKTYQYLNPSQLVLDCSPEELDSIDRFYTFKSKKAEQAYKNHKHALWYRNKHGHEEWATKLEELKAAIEVHILDYLDDGRPVLLAGFACELESVHGFKLIGDKPLNAFEAGLDNWPTVGERKTARYYQTESVAALLKHRHAAVSLATGSGKSYIIEDLVRQHGVKSLVIAPSKSIAKQLYKQLINTFGPKLVGIFDGSKKQSGRDIVVGIDKSLTNVEPGTPHWKELSKSQLLIVDESHLCPTEALRSVCLGLVVNAPYRYFVSATQFRNDGADKLLDGLIGPIVYEKTLDELVEQGFLARPKYLGIKVMSPSNIEGDYDTMIDTHVYKNPELAKVIAGLAVRYSKMGKKVLVLIDRIAQFRLMLPYLPTGSFEFAHGDISIKEKDEMPQQYWKCDVDDLVNRFNQSKIPILIGTSCITTGTDLQPTDVILYVMAGQSMIKVQQARGRGTRLVPGKTEFLFVEFDVHVPGMPPARNVLHRHYLSRIKSYDRQDIPVIDLTNSPR